MTLTIQDHLLEEAGVTEQELKLEVAAILYQKGKLSLGKASELANIHKLAFQKELAKRKIPSNYNEEAFEQDLKTLGFHS